MNNKTLVLWFILLGLLACRTSALAGSGRRDLALHPDHGAIVPYTGSPKRVEKDPAFFLDRSDKAKDYEEIERRLQRLLEELKKLEKEVEEELRKEVLPYLQREIERLRKWLDQFRMRDDDQEPIKT